MKQQRVEPIAAANWSPPMVKNLPADDPLVLDALRDPAFAAAAAKAGLSTNCADLDRE